MPAKSSEQLLSIKEASRLTGVPSYTLRFWEKEFDEFLNPPRTDGGQRRYDKDSLDMVNRIKNLVDEEKYSIAGARGVLSTEQQQHDDKSDISQVLRNEAQIDLILDEIAEIVREKVLARLVQEGNNRVVGERVPGLKVQTNQAPAVQASIARPNEANDSDNNDNSENEADSAGSARPDSTSAPSFGNRLAEHDHAPSNIAGGSASNLHRVASPLGNIPVPNVSGGS